MEFPSGDQSKSPRFEPPPQRLPLLLGRAEPPAKQIALTPAVFQFGVQTSAAWKAGDQITNK